MHVQLSKEWRLIRPGLVAAVGLALLPLSVMVVPEPRADVGFLLTFCMFLGGVLLGIETFGREFHQQTSTLWLALPMSRAGLWRSKLTMVGLAVAGVTLVHWLALLAGTPWRGLLPNLVEVTRPVVAIVGGAALGLCWSVLLRQTWAAFWMSLIVPGALMMAIQLLVALLWPMPENDQAAAPQPDFGRMFALGFCLVGGIAFFLARRRFDRLEDLGPVGEDVQLSTPRFLRSLGWASAGAERRKLTASSSLWRKEIRLQQLNLALAAGFALVILCVYFLRHLALMMPDRFSPRDFEFVELLWALWCLLPLTIGLVTMAEERRLGVDAWQETLPVNRARRWWIKLGAAYGLAFAIGVIVPVIGETITKSGPPLGMLIFHAMAWLIMTTAGVYVSSLARNLVHAISILVPFAVALTLATVGGLWLTRVWSAEPVGSYAGIPIELHFMVVTGALLFVAVLWLAWRNSTPGRGESLALRSNVSLLATAWFAGVLLVSGGRARAWEWLRPEPSPRSALTVHPGVQPDVLVGWTHVAALTPDGSLWIYGSPGVFGGSMTLRRLGEGHRWLSAGVESLRLIAVREDHTLWRWGQDVMPDPDRPNHEMRTGDLQSSWETPTRIGVDSNWASVAVGQGHSMALKLDGSLWGWGNNWHGQLGEINDQFVAAPTRIGAATNWNCVAVDSNLSLAANRDGEVWTWGGTAGRRGKDGRFLLPQVPRRIATGIAWTRLIAEDQLILGVDEQGGVWTLQDYSWVAGGDRPTRWQGVTGPYATMNYYQAWAIEGGGSLMHWTAETSGTHRTSGPPSADSFRRVGKRQDWIALDSRNGLETCFGLTADGGLWSWGIPLERQERSWLPPSQRPHQVALLRE